MRRWSGRAGGKGYRVVGVGATAPDFGRVRGETSGILRYYGISPCNYILVSVTLCFKALAGMSQQLIGMLRIDQLQWDAPPAGRAESCFGRRLLTSAGRRLPLLRNVLDLNITCIETK